MGNECREPVGSLVTAILVTAAMVAGIYATLVAGIYWWVISSGPQ